MEGQLVEGVSRRLECNQRFAAEVPVGWRAAPWLKQKRTIGVVRIQQVHPADVVGVVPRQDGQPGVQQVVALLRHLRIVSGERLPRGGHRTVQHCGIAVVHHGGHGACAEIAAVQRQLSQGGAKIAHDRSGAFVDQRLGPVRGRVSQVRREADLRVMEVAALRVNLAADRTRRLTTPVAHEDRIRRNRRNVAEDVGHRLRGRFLQRQHAHIVVAEPQMRTVAFKR